MQPIQDKDFDQLFKNAFEDAEITPSRNLWSSIESEIEPKKKRIVPLYWLSAAAVLLIATVGLLVYQQQEVKPNQFANHVEPQKAKPIIETSPVNDSSKTITTPVRKVDQVLPSTTQHVEAIAKTAVKEKVRSLGSQKQVTAPEMQKQEIMIAKVEEPKKDIKAKIDEAILKSKDETVLASNANTISIDEVVGESDHSENKGIRNVGDVVNLIMDKVDKRKDKLIQFRTDDDDSSISSVNIGPFRIGKKSRK
ncbi:hypothetical protein EV200_10186 [Pedobacter psychrotolerans]|uniref:Uncharacterized protein n=1 Tax=Pedobacter psychrotolerans TaxID=1843235 RepID=A0A4R2HLB2_9SPHI|nr:hypothetical protein [Pedobacter psychrotolerans]TCO30653.1 hypothetical protein EV200_10186 [Pedobacter psychrotolerans]GGE68560.1 hypothetical protein GCM10011413_39030 [Pedobacter psychrotolerans]